MTAWPPTAAATGPRRRFAFSAYLDGFEPLEPALSARNKELLTQGESAMLTYRAAMDSNAADKVAEGASTIELLLARAEAELDPAKAEAATAFVGALTILLREGIEALLVVVGMTFLRKSGRPEVLRHVHAGWIGALAAGGLTWAAATYVVSISGANREVTEGVSSAVAAVVLLGVGLWMHQKSAAGRWQSYVRDNMSTAMSRSSAYAMAGLAFVAVYREVFETALFFSALWTEGNGAAPRRPRGRCGNPWRHCLDPASHQREDADRQVLFCHLDSRCGVGGGVDRQGSQGTQKAGIFSVHPVPFLRIEFLGVYPTDETLAAQAVVAAIALIGFWLNSRLTAGSAASARGI